MLGSQRLASSVIAGTPEHVECIVIGAGVVGLAVARSIALQGTEVRECSPRLRSVSANFGSVD
jgi:NADPH-dependent 2,4-dienoyl-CoA reductase/sulfur reductase-like enzyme